jgi:hypothetical protein
MFSPGHALDSKIKHIVAAGSSFTADGRGGVPLQGNSFFPDGAVPRTWASWLAKWCQAQSMINLAASGHGNMLTALALPWILEHCDYDPDHTLVLVQFTTKPRYDEMCVWDHPHRSPHVPWTQQDLPFTFLDRSHADEILRAQDIDMIEWQNLQAARSCLAWLSQSPWRWRAVIDQGNIGVDHAWLDPMAMLDRSRDLDDVTADQHPGDRAHRAIAEKIFDTL